MAFHRPLIIIGAGVVGLALGHALKKAGVPFTIYERDEHISARTQGWAITLHWALPILRDILDPATLASLDKVQVDPKIGQNDTGNFLFLNLETLETKFRIPPNERKRVNREGMRRVLVEGLTGHIRWGKKLQSVEVLDNDNDGRVKALFDDGTEAEGSILIGAEGSKSRTRQFVAPKAYHNAPIPVRFLGVGVKLTPPQVKPLRDLDPLLFQGCHPRTGTFLWVSIMSTPEQNGSYKMEHAYFMVQINMSWLKDVEAEPALATDVDRLAEMRLRAKPFHPRLNGLIDSLPSDTSVLDVAMHDWPCLDWNNHDGRVTLVGDAAHAMSMYRGEAANHGILDAWHLANVLKEVHEGESRRNLKEVIDLYESEMRERTQWAVELSRQACMEAHDLDGLNENSAVLRRRAVRG